MVLAAALAAAGASSPPAGAAPAAELTAVYPSGPALPENALRLTLSFATPAEGSVLSRLNLRGPDGSTVAEPFLDIELRSPDGRLVTVFLHPGRVKTGLVANERLGRALRAGERVTLVLAGRGAKTWEVGPPRMRGLDPRRWTMTVPRAGTRETMTATFDAPLDRQAMGLIAVQGPDGGRAEGEASMGAGESSWSFTPAVPWADGPHLLRLHPELEDAAGNRVDLGFEHREGEGSAAAALAFTPSP